LTVKKKGKVERRFVGAGFFMLSDIHLHTRFSGDARGEPEEFVIRAMERGLDVIGFSEHWDFGPGDKSYGFYDYENVRAEIERVRHKYTDRIEILFGVEVSYASNREDDIQDALSGKEFDYIIGGVHVSDGVYISEPRCRPYLKRRSAAEVYTRFFEETEKAVESGLFDIIAHLDLCKRYGVEFYGPFDVGQVSDGLVEDVIRKTVAAGVALEVNASGTWQGPKEPYPAGQILEIYRDAGGELITLGSDAHEPARAGDVSAAVELVAAVGLPETVVFRGRKAQF
jgi:histidinol-phosphatase (PHP family)